MPKSNNRPHADGPRRYVTLADGRHISLGAYVNAWKACLGAPPGAWIRRGVSGWGETAAPLAELRRGLDDRINRHIVGYDKGRKWSSDWQRATLQAANALNTPRLVIHWLPPHLLSRFRHRLATD